MAYSLVYLYFNGEIFFCTWHELYGPDDEPVGQSSQPIASVTDVPKASDDKRDSPDVDVPDESFSVKKSSPRNGADIFESSKGAGGLGEGSPKVSAVFANYSF